MLPESLGFEKSPGSGVSKGKGFVMRAGVERFLIPFGYGADLSERLVSKAKAARTWSAKPTRPSYPTVSGGHARGDLFERRADNIKGSNVRSSFYEFSQDLQYL